MVDGNYSPLDTLVRKASSKQSPRSAQHLEVSSTLPRNTRRGAPPSPLLHTYFRSSFATSESSYENNSFQDDESVNNLSRQSWQSTDSDSTTKQPKLLVNENSATTPTVVVTAPDLDSASLYGTTHPDPHPPPAYLRSPITSRYAISSTTSLFLPKPRPVPTNSGGIQRAVSQESLYSSSYSYYELDETGRPATIAGPSDRSTRHSHSDVQPTNSGPQTPQEYLQLGIQHHEANRLTQSAICFEKSATFQGGCGVGMLMFGLTLRHGWGCPKNEKNGLHWLQKAANSAVVDLESGRAGMDAGAVQSELVIAIYEVGQSFFQGWGVQKDKKMAVSYFQVAARLGDPDAQQSLAFCLANGKGCKKDKKEAAKWYRAAVAQGGISDVGLAWIYKEKYQ